MGYPQASPEQPQGSLALLRSYAQERERLDAQERPWGVTPDEWDAYRRGCRNPWWRLFNGALVDLVERGYSVDDRGRFTLLEPVALCNGHHAWWHEPGDARLVCGVCHPPVRGDAGVAMSARERLDNPDAILTRSDLRELGWPRRGIDAIIRHAGSICLPGYSRPVVTVAAYRAFLEANRYDGRTRVR
jgi:hypothetical protein